MTVARNSTPSALADELAVWDLRAPDSPRLIGVTSLVAGGRSLAFEYDADWLATGYALSGDLPLRKAPIVPVTRDKIPGALEDALPDRWGERAIRFLENPPRLSPLDFLYFTGDDRFGALGFSVDRSAYVPHDRGPLPTMESLATLQDLIARIDASEPLNEWEKLIASTTKTMGGAHPKAILSMNGKEWIAKFPRSNNIDTGLVEHATMKLAGMAGILAAETIPLRTAFGHVIAVERFDRKDGERIRSMSAKTALLNGVGNGPPALDELSYGGMASLLQQIGKDNQQAAQRTEIFRRMAFNILVENSDDHEKNHAFVFEGECWALAPAFDVLPTTLNAGAQQMIVGRRGAEDTLENALSECHLFGLSRDEAIEAWFYVAGVVDRWEAVFASLNVAGKDLAYLRGFIDQPARKLMRSRDILATLPRPDASARAKTTRRLQK